MEKKRVVITGLGAVTPVGTDVETAWENIKKGCIWNRTTYKN